jgi:hypothetical protein
MLLPLGILVSATLADLGAAMSGLRFFATIAHADMVPGLLSGVLALCALLVDLVTAPVGSIARAVMSVVCVAFGSMVGVFTVVWSLGADSGGAASGGLFVLEVIALICGVMAARFARGLVVGRALPRVLESVVATHADHRQSVRPADVRWVPSCRPDDPDATVAIFGIATGRAPVRAS